MSGYLGVATFPGELSPALAVGARLTEIERRVDLLRNTTPVNAAEAWVDFERSDFGTSPTLRLRPLELEPDLLPVLQSGLSTVSLTGGQWLVATGLALLLPIAVESSKWVRLRRTPAGTPLDVGTVTAPARAHARP